MVSLQVQEDIDRNLEEARELQARCLPTDSAFKGFRGLGVGGLGF